MEINEEKINQILAVNSKFKDEIQARYLNTDGLLISAAILTNIYFDNSLDYKQLKDSIRDGIEQSHPLHGYDGPL